MESRGLRAILIVLAVTLVLFGGWPLVDPMGFYTFSGLELSDDAGLLSEVRGAGGIKSASRVRLRFSTQQTSTPASSTTPRCSASSLPGTLGRFGSVRRGDAALMVCERNQGGAAPVSTSASVMRMRFTLNSAVAGSHSSPSDDLVEIA
jgi:hypothetical protein